MGYPNNIRFYHVRQQIETTRAIIENFKKTAWLLRRPSEALSGQLGKLDRLLAKLESANRKLHKLQQEYKTCSQEAMCRVSLHIGKWRKKEDLLKTMIGNNASVLRQYQAYQSRVQVGAHRGKNLSIVAPVAAAGIAVGAPIAAGGLGAGGLLAGIKASATVGIPAAVAVGLFQFLEPRVAGNTGPSSLSDIMRESIVFMRKPLIRNLFRRYFSLVNLTKPNREDIWAMESLLGKISDLVRGARDKKTLGREVATFCLKWLKTLRHEVAQKHPPYKPSASGLLRAHATLHAFKRGQEPDYEKTFLQMEGFGNLKAPKDITGLLSRFKPNQWRQAIPFFRKWLFTHIGKNLEGAPGIKFQLHNNFMARHYIRAPGREWGSNCQASQTKLILALLQKAGLKLPRGVHLGIQVFSDHVQAVLILKRGGRWWAYSILEGKVISPKKMAPVFHPIVAIDAYVRGAGLMSPLEQKDYLLTPELEGLVRYRSKPDYRGFPKTGRADWLPSLYPGSTIRYGSAGGRDEFIFRLKISKQKPEKLYPSYRGTPQRELTVICAKNEDGKLPVLSVLKCQEDRDQPYPRRTPKEPKSKNQVTVQSRKKRIPIDLLMIELLRLGASQGFKERGSVIFGHPPNEVPLHKYSPSWSDEFGKDD